MNMDSNNTISVLHEATNPSGTFISGSVLIDKSNNLQETHEGTQIKFQQSIVKVSTKHELFS